MFDETRSLKNPLPYPSVCQQAKQRKDNEDYSVGEQRSPKVAGPASHDLSMHAFNRKGDKSILSLTPVSPTRAFPNRSTTYCAAPFKPVVTRDSRLMNLSRIGYT